MSLALTLINGPLELYWAPVGEAMPEVDAAPAGNWSLVGTSGSDNFTEDGVVLEFDKNFEVFRGLGNTYALKSFLTETDAFVRVTMADLSLEQFRLAFNNNPVVVDAGPPAIEYVDLDVSSDLVEMALLVRGEGKSPQFAGGNMQFEFFRTANTGSHEMTFEKGNAAGVELEFQIMKDATSGIGRFVVQTA